MVLVTTGKLLNEKVKVPVPPAAVSVADPSQLLAHLVAVVFRVVEIAGGAETLAVIAVVQDFASVTVSV